MYQTRTFSLNEQGSDFPGQKTWDYIDRDANTWLLSLKTDPAYPPQVTTTVREVRHTKVYEKTIVVWTK
jgi:hypothetical protein